MITYTLKVLREPSLGEKKFVPKKDTILTENPNKESIISDEDMERLNKYLSFMETSKAESEYYFKCMELSAENDKLKEENELYKKTLKLCGKMLKDLTDEINAF